MENKYQNPDIISSLINNRKARWAIVGLSNKPERTAYGVAEILKNKLGMKIIPVNPRGENVLGEQGYKTLAEVPGRIDVVDCFVNSERVCAVVDEAIERGAHAVWLQLGVIDEAAAERAQAAGLHVVMNTCPVIQAETAGML